MNKANFPGVSSSEEIHDTIMPFLFTLSTTSSVSFPSCVSSSSHPSLPLSATSYRSVLRNALKKHRRLSPRTQSSNLNTVLAALDGYIPYLMTLDAGLSDLTIREEEIDVTLQEEVDVEWRSSIAAKLPGRPNPRVKGKGLDYEICCVFSTLGYVYSLLARSQLHMLYETITPTTEQRVSIIAAATKRLLEANTVHAHLANRCGENATSGVIPEISSTAQRALAELALAEATLLAVLKDDPWPGVVAQERNKNDKEWMIKPPEIPKVRAHLFARLCLAAADHAGMAEAMLNSVARGPTGCIDDTLIRYTTDLRRTSRAKACRFFGIDADMGGETGKGIAWLMAGEDELGFAKSHADGAKLQGLAKFKKDWTEKREDKKTEKGGDWGRDAGRLEEARVIEVLKTKWNKINDIVSCKIRRS